MIRTRLPAVTEKQRNGPVGTARSKKIRSPVVPAAASGILAAVLLGFGRIIGETLIVLMVAGNSLAVPYWIFDPVRPMTANIAIEIKEVVIGGLHYEALFAVGLLLFIYTFVVNIIADVFIKNRLKV